MIDKYTKPHYFKNIHINNILPSFAIYQYLFSTSKYNLKDSANKCWNYYEFQEILLMFLYSRLVNNYLVYYSKLRYIEILSVDFNANLQNFDKNIYQTITTNLILNNLTDILKALHLQDPMQVEEFLTISDEDIIYIVPDDDQIIIELISIFKSNIKENSDEKNINKIYSGSEVPLVSFTIQDNISKIENFIREKQINSMKQTTIDKYFKYQIKNILFKI
ncbi:hypothetical protein BC936DRAFT_148839, partial [Jimgerdemannia flammicorona]